MQRLAEGAVQAILRAPTARRSTSVGICASKAALCATGHARTAADTNAVHDRLLQSMRVRFSDSEQWSSPVKPPRSQNYVKPHDARTRVHLVVFGALHGAGAVGDVAFERGRRL